jgi:hypothetical protein
MAWSEEEAFDLPALGASRSGRFQHTTRALTYRLSSPCVADDTVLDFQPLVAAEIELAALVQ